MLSYPEESLEQLKICLPIIDQKNKYLFQSSRQGHMDEETINYALKDLADKARMQLTGSLRFHCFRKLFLRTAAELGVTSWNAKLLVGKAVEKSVATYINGVQLREDLIKISNVLRLIAPRSVRRTCDLRRLIGTVQND